MTTVVVELPEAETFPDGVRYFHAAKGWRVMVKADGTIVDANAGPQFTRSIENARSYAAALLAAADAAEAS